MNVTNMFYFDDNNHFLFGLDFFLPNALPQGQLTKVPLHFENCNLKVELKNDIFWQIAFNKIKEKIL